MNKNKRKSLEKTYQHFINAGLTSNNLEILEEVADQNVMGFGTTVDEKIFSLTDLRKLMRIQKEQSEGLSITWDIKPLHRHIAEDENTAVFADDLFLNFTTGCETVEMYLRISVVLEYKNGKWKVIHWHGSKPENVKSEEDTYGIETWKEKAEALEKLVAERTQDLVVKNRELEIEAALERVRSRSMAMHNTSELQEVIHTVHNELLNLNISINGGSFIAINNDIKNEIRCWGSGGTANTSEEVHIPRFEKPFYTNLIKGIKKGQEFFTEEYTQQEKKEFFTHLFKHQPWSELSSKEKKEILSSPGGYTRSCCVLKNISIFIINHFGRKFSKAENDILKRFTKVFEQTYTRFLDLQKAEEQAREAQIELGLERVRARTMAMKHSEELADTASVLFQQIKNLGFETWSCGFCIWTENDQVEAWMGADSGGLLPPMLLPYKKEKTHREIYESFKNGEVSHVRVWKGEALREHYEFMQTLPSIKKAFDVLKNSGLQLPTYQCYYVGFFKYGYLLLITTKTNDELKDLSIRFAKVFEQTYTRFLDLQKAEAQAREAKIEAALERVRSRTIGMQRSDELQEAALLLFQQVEALGVPLFACGFNIWDSDKKSATAWMGSISGLQPPFKTDSSKDIYLPIYEAAQRGESLFVKEQGGKELEAHYAFLITIPEVKKMAEAGLTFPTFQIMHCSFFAQGYLMFITYKPVPDAYEIFKRFTKVFEQTYTRFLDLQKAEAQARESQIQLALERVRARSMAMHKSDELAALSFELVKQVQALGVATWFCAFNIYDEDQKGSLEWGSNAEGTYPNYRTPREGIFLRYYEAGQSGETMLINEIGENECPAHYEYLCSLPGVGEQLLKMRDSGISFPNSQIDHVAYFKYGYIIFITFEQAPEAHDIFKRFAKVFEQTYTRFLDLQKAEEQAKVAVKQASLDRVRGEIASMRSAQDLERITPLIWNELNIMGIPFIRCGVFIVHEKKENVEVYLSSFKGQSLAVLHLPFGSNDLTIQSVDAWRKGKVYIQHWNKEDFQNWSKTMMDQGQIQDKETYQGADAPPESLDLHFVPFTQGMLYVGSPHSLSKVDIDLVKSLAEAFEIAYARYEDFVKLEEAKESIEVALNELKATQAQLIQSEKLASLGQLTAGIAHEIKNPLNFVNNFSDLSIDLIEEVFEELDKTKDHENNEEIREILTVVKSNLEKIYQHGSRADGIVKSMLQHSRGGSGKMEPTDLNALVKEYVNLAFHGMRASKNPINVSLKFDLDTQLSPVKLISEDFSRVILNLCNNAFDAMREKTKTDKNYQPVLTLKTEETGNHVLLSVADNGTGIPGAIKDKILQPFFTTKKGTEGTGLGLSLSYDIVKTHGGELKVETMEGDGTEFLILLPGKECTVPMALH